MRKAGLYFALVLILVTCIYSIINYYGYLFARSVHGEVMGVERVTQATTVIGMGGEVPAAQLYSFAVAIKQKDGEIVAASSEDRQWAVVQKGQCVEAKFFPYAPWILDKAGTYYGARLLKLFECPK
jgi:hypothetical protein